jgi:hypothetical protein
MITRALSTESLSQARAALYALADEPLVHLASSTAKV